MKEWMAENCCIAFVDDKGPVALSDFTKFLSARNQPGQTQLAIRFPCIYACNNFFNRHVMVMFLFEHPFHHTQHTHKQVKHAYIIY